MSDRELERRLRAVREPLPPPDLRVRLEQGIPGSFRQPESWWSARRVWNMAKIGAVAAAATVIVAAAVWMAVAFLVGTGGAGAAFASALEPVASATGEANAVHAVLLMRTREGEDFSYVDVGGDLRRIEVWVQGPLGGSDAGRARMEKADRIYVFDGTEAIFYHPKRNEAFRGRGAGIGTELLWPAAWVREVQGLPADGVEVIAREETDGRGRIVLREKGKPVEKRAPVFLGEFDRETEVTWDLGTHRLTGLRRWVDHEGERLLFSEIESIEYLPAIDEAKFRIELPADVRWGGVKEAPREVVALGPREVARRVFEAAARGDREALEIYCPAPSTVEWLVENRPAEILFLGEPFRTGDYPGVYVPYAVRFGTGRPSEVRKHNLALRSDNDQGRWVLDGGI